MSIQLLLFLGLALVAIATAIGMLMSRSAVYAALFLVLNFATVAVFYILLSSPFIAMSQVSVYAGAIMVLFLFVIMLLGTQSLPRSEALPWQRPVAAALALVLIVEAAYVLFGRNVTSAVIQPPVETFGSPQAVGRALFSQYLLPFEVTSVLLLVAMLGAIILTHREKRGK